jgi:tripartite-type tricarboxylate transporter receptor subunit TctC
VFAPAGLAPEVAAKLREAVRSAVNDPDFQKAMANVNTPIQYQDAPEFAAFVKADGERLAEVVRKMGKTQ